MSYTTFVWFRCRTYYRKWLNSKIKFTLIWLSFDIKYLVSINAFLILFYWIQSQSHIIWRHSCRIYCYCIISMTIRIQIIIQNQLLNSIIRTDSFRVSISLQNMVNTLNWTLLDFQFSFVLNISNIFILNKFIPV